jgi:VWFA-related protein
LGTALPVSAAPAAAPQAEEPARPITPLDLPFELVEVRLVLLHATVLDRKGESVAGLAPDDFVVTDQGITQELVVFGDARQQPLEIAFLLDASGSMRMGGKIERARDVIRSLAAGLRSTDRVALYTFSEGEVVARAGFEAPREQFLVMLEGVEPGGRTALYDALIEAPRVMGNPARVRRGIVLITDGVDNASSQGWLEALGSASRVPVPIYVIGLKNRPAGQETRPAASEEGRTLLDLLSDLARESGGEIFPVFAAEEVDLAIQTIETRLRGQYLLGYHPRPSGGEAGVHRVEVSLPGTRHSVLVRRGYVNNP